MQKNLWNKLIQNLNSWTYLSPSGSFTLTMSWKWLFRLQKQLIFTDEVKEWRERRQRDAAQLTEGWTDDRSFMAMLSQLLHSFLTFPSGSLNPRLLLTQAPQTVLMLTDIQAIFTNEWSFHKWSVTPSPRSPTAVVLGVMPCLCTGLGPTHLETHTRNYGRPSCQLPPCLSGSSQPRFPCSASWGVLVAMSACPTVCYCREGHWQG